MITGCEALGKSNTKGARLTALLDDIAETMRHTDSVCLSDCRQAPCATTSGSLYGERSVMSLNDAGNWTRRRAALACWFACMLAV